MQAAHRYVDILSDAGFKAVFGDRRNEEVLKDLLNVLLPSHRKVSSLEYMTTELPQFSPFSKSVRLDLRCKGDDGTVFIVEVQCYRQKNFFRRCVLYASKAYAYGSERGDRGEYGLAPVYFIGLLGGEIQELQIGSEEKYKLVREYTFREKESGEVPDETINFIFLCVNGFRKPLEACDTMLEKWSYALKYVGALERLPERLRAEAFERLFRACEIAKFEPGVKLTYEKDMITERDYYNIIDTAREDGLEKGRMEGRMEGRIEGEKSATEKIAQSMKSAGIELPVIVQVTGMSETEIAAL